MMRSPNRPCSSRSVPEAAASVRRPSARDRGYAFLILMLLVTILLISLTAAVPDILTQGRREREAELIFRGNQYARAIALFHRQFNRYPASIEELTQKTNGYRFLRHPFSDPMSPSGKWRFIHADANGVVLDSKTLVPPGGKQAKPGASDQASQKTDEAGMGTGQETGKEETKPPEGAAQDVKGAFIVGVASTNSKQSIRVYDDQDHYDHWEFLGIPSTASGAAPGPGQPPASSPPGAGTSFMPSPTSNPPPQQ